jgi:hypothetical protein
MLSRRNNRAYPAPSPLLCDYVHAQSFPSYPIKTSRVGELGIIVSEKSEGTGSRGIRELTIQYVYGEVPLVLGACVANPR